MKNPGRFRITDKIRYVIKPQASEVHLQRTQAHLSDFHHVRINHSERFVDERSHINGIENFWNQAKRHLRRFNGVPKQSFHLFLKECEWRFNGGDHRELLNQLKTWIILRQKRP